MEIVRMKLSSMILCRFNTRLMDLKSFRSIKPSILGTKTIKVEFYYD